MSTERGNCKDVDFTPTRNLQIAQSEREITQIIRYVILSNIDKQILRDLHRDGYTPSLKQICLTK